MKKVNNYLSALEKYIPHEILKLKEENIRDIVKNTDTNILHKKFKELDFLYSAFVKFLKEEIISRIKTTDRTFIETSVGSISLVKRTDIKVEDETTLLNKLEEIGIDYHEIFDEDYEIVTRNKKILKTLLDKGIIVKTHKVNRDKLKIAIEKYPELENYIIRNTTEFLKGL